MSKDMKLIMENWNRFLQDDLLSVDSESKARKTKIYLFEGKQKQPRSCSFGTLLENHDKGLLSEAKLIQLWETSYLYEVSRLDEDLGDIIKQGYESVQAGAIKLKDQISDKVAVAMEKVNDFFLKITLQGIELAKRSLVGAVKAAKMLWEKIEDFRYEHPILFKIILVVAITLIILGIMAAFSNPAAASVKMKNGTMMSEFKKNAVRGLLDSMADKAGADNMDAQQIAKTTNQLLDNAFQSKKTIPIEKLGKLTNAAVKTLDKLYREYKGGNKVSGELIMKWAKLGKRLKYG